MAARTETEKRLHRLLKDDLGKAVARTKRGTWMTTSNLPHEIRLHTEASVELVRISAGIVIDTEPSESLFEEMNRLNAERAFSRRILVDGKVLVVAEMPVASLHGGDLEQLVSMVCCFARLDAEALAEHGGRPLTEPPAALAPHFDTPLNNWWDVLRASGTSTARELAVWLDELTGCDCWIDRDDENVVFVVSNGTGIGSAYPCTLEDLRQAAIDGESGGDEDEDEEADELDDDVPLPYNQAAIGNKHWGHYGR